MINDPTVAECLNNTYYLSPITAMFHQALLFHLTTSLQEAVMFRLILFVSVKIKHIKWVPSEQLHLILSNFRKYLSFNLFHMYVFTLEEIHNTENTTFTHSQIYSFALSPLLT